MSAHYLILLGIGGCLPLLFSIILPAIWRAWRER